MGQTRNGDVRTVGSARTDSTGGNSSTDNCGGGGYQKEFRALAATYQETLIKLMLRTDGYLRVIPDGEQKQIYLKWKFTSGRFAGSYVMAVVTPWSVMEGHILLYSKIERSYNDAYSPSVDKPYQSD